MTRKTIDRLRENVQPQNLQLCISFYYTTILLSVIIPSLSSILSLFCLVDFLVNNPLKGPISISLKYIRRNSNGPLKVSSYSTVVCVNQLLLKKVKLQAQSLSVKEPVNFLHAMRDQCLISACSHNGLTKLLTFLCSCMCACWFTACLQVDLLYAQKCNGCGQQKYVCIGDVIGLVSAGCVGTYVNIATTQKRYKQLAATNECDQHVTFTVCQKTKGKAKQLGLQIVQSWVRMRLSEHAAVVLYAYVRRFSECARACK